MWAWGSLVTGLLAADVGHAARSVGITIWG